MHTANKPIPHNVIVQTSCNTVEPEARICSPNTHYSHSKDWTETWCNPKKKTVVSLFFSLFLSYYLVDFSLSQNIPEKALIFKKHHWVVFSITKYFKFNNPYSFSYFIWTKIQSKTLSINFIVRTDVNGVHVIPHLLINNSTEFSESCILLNIDKNKVLIIVEMFKSLFYWLPEFLWGTASWKQKLL